MRSRILVSFQYVLLFSAVWLLGGLAGHITARPAQEASGTALTQSRSWGLGFGEDGTPPAGTASAKELKKNNAFYLRETDEKILYLTFDCGYENGNMPTILETLKKHGITAAFFVVSNFIEDNPGLTRQMADEGHIVANHTMTHPDMSSISTMEAFRKELAGVEELYRETTGRSMTKFYRPPRGIYNEQNLEMAKELGYHTFFWSLAYVDWKEDEQPAREEAFGKLIPRVHPGAIVLLHSTSSTNAAILDELLDKWEEMGYSFGTLNDFLTE